jgi:hypothetical protein
VFLARAIAKGLALSLSKVAAVVFCMRAMLCTHSEIAPGSAAAGGVIVEW